MKRCVGLGVCALAITGLSGAARATTASDTIGIEASPAAPPSGAQPDLRNLLSDQFAFGRSTGSPSSVRSGFLMDRLSGSNDLSASLGILYGLTVTQDLGARASAGSPFPDRGGTILRLSTGLEWQLSRRWALIPTVSGSLPSTTQTSISVPYQATTGAETTLAGDLRVKASTVGGEVSAEYDTLDDWAVELVVTLTGGVTNYWITQGLTKLQLADDTIISAAALEQQCQTSGCSQQVRGLLAKPTSSVLQGYGEVDVTAIIRRTDVGLSATGFGYSQDPGQLGFFGVASFARGAAMGDGYPLAPLLVQVRGHAVQKLGAWRLAGSADYARYVDSEGSSASATFKAAYSPLGSIRLWVSGTFQRDDIVSLGVVDTVVAAIGLRWTF